LQPIRAVITADVVQFTGLTRELQQQLIGKISSALSSCRYDFYRGDSFSAYLENPGSGLSLALRLRLIALNHRGPDSANPTDLRASIGIGAVDEPMESLRTATGEAFTISGRNLDQILNSKQRLILQSTDPSQGPVLRVIAAFMDYLLGRLTAKQAEVIAVLLEGKTQVEVAEQLHKSQATISQHVQSSGWAEIEMLLKEYELLWRGSQIENPENGSS